MSFDGIMFDLDGTLWDSREGITAGWNDTMKKLYGTDTDFTIEDITSIMGLTERGVADKLFTQYGDARYELCKSCLIGEVAYLRGHGARIYDGVEGMLADLSAHTPLFLVSNCQADYMRAFFEISGFARYFADCLCEGDTGLEKADNIKLLAERHRLKKTVYVGDTALDEKSAREANCSFVHAVYGFGTAENPDGCISAPGELAALIARMEEET